jgi:hypothetical protein
MAFPRLFPPKAKDSPGRFIIVMIATFLCVIGITWAYTCFFPMRFEESGYMVWLAKFDVIESCSAGSTVVLGDSRAQSAFVPERFSRTSTNLAFGAATPLEVYLVFKRLVPCLTDGQHVLVSIAPIEFQKISPFLWENGVRYGFFSLGDIRELAAGASIVHDETLSHVETRFGTGLTRDLIYGSRFPSIYFNNLVNARVILRGEINQQLLDRATNRRGFLPFGDRGGATSPVDEARFQHFKPLPVDDLFFRKMIGLAAQKRVVLDFIAAPVSELSLRSIAQSYQADFATYMALLDPTHATFRVIGPLFYSFPDFLFADSYHLKEAGADSFTTWLGHCIDAEVCNPADLTFDSTDLGRNQNSSPQ